jgi:pimeloyl-ACP methyl ester carboxylesterase
MSSKLRLGATLVAAALLLAGVLPVYERFFGRKRLRFPYLARPIAAARYAELAAAPGWAKAELEVAPGIKLRGLLRRPAQSTAPWVLYYPGNDESQLERGHSFLSRLAGQLDWGLAVFAYRGYDASDGKPGLADIRSDAPRIFSELCKTEHLSPAQVHLAGFSIGGYFATYTASVAAAQGARAASLTLLASVDDIVMYHPSPWEKLSAGEDYQTHPYLPGVPAPVLVLQGDADKALEGPGQGRAIAKALGDRAEYLELPGVEHVPLLGNATALERVRAFITSHAR